MNRQDALDLLHEYTKGEPLRKHGLAVEAAMRAYARKYGQDEDTWGMMAAPTNGCSSTVGCAS